MLANQLGRHGIRPMIIDRHRKPAQQTRATAVQARTLEIYSKLGVLPQSLALGKRSMAVNRRTEGHQTARCMVPPPSGSPAATARVAWYEKAAAFDYTGRKGCMARGLVSHADYRQARRVCDESRARPDACLSHHFPDRHTLSQQPSLAHGGGLFERRAAPWRTLPVVAAQVERHRGGRGLGR